MPKSIGICSILIYKESGTRKSVTSVHAFRDHAQNTGIYSVFASLYNILHKDLEQENLSQASMPSATMPKTLLFTAFYAQKHWNLQHFNMPHKESGTRKSVTSVHAFRDHAQTTRIYSVVCPIHWALLRYPASKNPQHKTHDPAFKSQIL